MRRDIAEAGHLCVLGGEVGDRVSHEVREGEGLVDARCREVADRHPDRVPVRLGSQPPDHRR